MNIRRIREIGNGRRDSGLGARVGHRNFSASGLLDKCMPRTLITAFALYVSLLAGCSQKTSNTAATTNSVAKAEDPRLAADMRTITNIIVKGKIYQQIEAGEMGSVASMQIAIGSNSDQRHYILTWRDSKWQVTPTNQ